MANALFSCADWANTSTEDSLLAGVAHGSVPHPNSLECDGPGTKNVNFTVKAGGSGTKSSTFAEMSQRIDLFRPCGQRSLARECAGPAGSVRGSAPHPNSLKVDGPGTKPVNFMVEAGGSGTKSSTFANLLRSVLLLKDALVGLEPFEVPLPTPTR